MEDSTKGTGKSNSAKPSFWHSPTHVFILIAILLVLFIAAAVVSRNQKAEAPAKVSSTTSTAGLKLEADTTVADSENVTVSIWEDSGGESVNAVQANISYPADQLEFINYDSYKSPFEIEAQNSQLDGSIIIVRGHKGSLTGRQLVGKLNFKVKSGSNGQAKLEFTKGTALISSKTNKDISGSNAGLSLSAENN